MPIKHFLSFLVEVLFKLIISTYKILNLVAHCYKYSRNRVPAFYLQTAQPATICGKIGVITDKCCQTLARWLEQTFNIFVPTKSQNQETMKACIFYEHIC